MEGMPKVEICVGTKFPLSLGQRRSRCKVKGGKSGVFAGPTKGIIQLSRESVYPLPEGRGLTALSNSHES